MRLIDADALMDDVRAHSYPLTNAYTIGVDDDGMFTVGFQQVVDEQPTVDAVPVVRCRECILHDSCYTEDVFKFAGLNDDSRFCGVGERKGGEQQ